MVPSSCGQCRPTDLLSENQVTWQLACRFAGLVSENSMNGRVSVDYAAARWVAEKSYIIDEMFWLESLEAIAKGLNNV